MKLISELVEETSFITEINEAGKKEHYIEGRYIALNKPNKNGRYYAEKHIAPEIGRYIKEVINAKRAFGELGNPQGPTINLDRVSHIITELKKDGDYYVGKARITETPMGEIAKGLMSSGGQLGVSTRGMGSLLEKNGVMEVQPDFKLSTVDIVSDPSGPGCFVNGIMENVEWIYDPVKNSWHEEKLHEMKKEIHKMTKEQIEANKIAMFENYIASLTVKDYLI